MTEEDVMAFCEMLPRLRRAACAASADPHDAAELEAVTETVRRGAGDMQAVTDLGHRLGVRVVDGRTYAGGYSQVPGTTGGGGGILRHRCPRGLCARSEDPTASVTTPRCEIWDAELRPVWY
ncbi:hypothetical protein [Actinacidiphila glaucinigra]|uniref:hypothetical protein n=1 Tax=Actinacidiphila glaucinigra TaxID=235986 RepID=UPI0036F03C23